MIRSGNQRRQEMVWVLLIVLLAMVLRTVLASLPRVIRWDEPDYLWLGQSLFSGHGYTINGVPELHYTPLFPILVGAIYWLTGKPEFASAFWYVLLGGLLILPVYALAQRLYGRKVALLSAVLVALFPAQSSTVLFWGTMTEPLFGFLVYMAAWASAVALEREQWWRYGLVGALLCLAYLARPEGIVWLSAFVVLFILLWWLKGKLHRWRTWAGLASLLVAFILVSLPYMVFLHGQMGKWMATGKLGITYDIGAAVVQRDPVLYDQVTASIDPDSGEILWWSERRFERGVADIFLGDPLRFVQRTLTNTQALRGAIFSGTIMPMFLLAPIVLGWFHSPWTRRRFEYEFLLLATALPVLSFLPFHVETRFFSPAFPAMLIWVASGLSVFSEWFGETFDHWRRGDRTTTDVNASGGAQQAAYMGSIILLVVYMGLTQVRVMAQGQADLSYGHKEAGFWLAENTPADVAIMSRDLAISLYAQRGFVASPRADYAAYLDYARRHGATYLVVDERELRVLRPHLAFLLDEETPPPELERVYSVMDKKGRTIVYRIKDDNNGG